MSNKILRDPHKQAVTVPLLLAGAYLPGIFGTDDGTTFTVAAASTGRLTLLLNQTYKEQDIATAYTSGDTGDCVRLVPDMEIYARFDAGTYSIGDPLTVGANGRLTAATTGDVVVAFYEGTDGATLSNGDFADAIVANSYVAA